MKKAKTTVQEKRHDKTRHKYKKTSIGRSPNTKRRARKKYRGQG